MIVYVEREASSIKSIGSLDVRVFSGDELPSTGDAAGKSCCICSRRFAKLLAGNEPENLLLVQLTSAGYDGVPLDYYSSKGIPVANAGDVYSIPIAETVVWSILQFCKAFRNNPNNRRPKLTRSYGIIGELAGKKALILGTGNIGTAVAKRLSGFEVVVDGYNPHYPSKQGYGRVIQEFEQMKAELSEYNYVISTLPDNNETKGILNADFFGHMASNAVFVNVGRRATVVEQDLLSSLKKKAIKGAVLDMFEVLPNPVTNPFRRLDNVIVLPGVAAISGESKERLNQLIKENVMLVDAGTAPNHVINGVKQQWRR